MDVNLDEDFFNFESVSQTCGSASFVAGVDEELVILDKELTRREEQPRDSNESETNKKQTRHGLFGVGSGKLELGRKHLEDEEIRCILTGNRLIAKFPLTGVGKRLTMLPIRYKLKEERRKVLKMSVNKLKRIDDPESWLCRSVLINNTMKKLQRETRDEKFNGNARAGGSGRGSCDRVVQPEKCDPSRCDARDEPVTSPIADLVQDCGRRLSNVGGEPREPERTPDGTRASTPAAVQPQTVFGRESPRESASGSEDQFSREVERDDVPDVLSHLYMPPTPRMVTSIDSEDEATDEEEICSSANVAPAKNFSAKRTVEVDEGACAPKKQKSDSILGFALYETLFCGQSIATRDVGAVRDVAKEKATTGRHNQRSTGDGFNEDTCDSQYSCGHSATMFGTEFQTVAFHNLIAGLET